MIRSLLYAPICGMGLLLAKRKRYGRFTIYAGWDGKVRDLSCFFEKIASAIEQLPDEIEVGIALEHWIPKRILGTSGFTCIHDYPAVIEIAYSRTFDQSVPYVASEIYFFTCLRFYSQEKEESEALLLSKNKEKEFLRGLLKSAYHEYDINLYQSSRIVTNAQKRLFLEKMIKSKGELEY